MERVDSRLLLGLVSLVAALVPRASVAAAQEPPQVGLTWYAEAGVGLHLSWESPDPMASAGFGDARLGGSFAAAGGAALEVGRPPGERGDMGVRAFRVFLGARGELGSFPDGFFAGRSGGAFVEIAPELRVGVYVVGISVAPHLAWLHAGSAGWRSVLGYHLGLCTFGFRLRDGAALGQAALIAFLPTWLELSFDRYVLGDAWMSSMGIAFRWAI